MDEVQHGFGRLERGVLPVNVPGEGVHDGDNNREREEGMALAGRSGDEGKREKRNERGGEKAVGATGRPGGKMRNQRKRGMVIHIAILFLKHAKFKIYKLYIFKKYNFII